MRHNQTKKEAYQKINQHLKDSGDGQISTTDPEAKAVVFQRNSVKIGYNVQLGSDAKNKLLVAADTGDVNDTKALSVMVKKVQENIGKLENVLADKGYHSGRELKACEELGLTTFISPKESSSTKKNPAFSMVAFIYDKENDTYTCPANVTLITNGRWYNKNLSNGRKSYPIKHYKTEACTNWKLQIQCTKSIRGRYIERTEYQQYISRNNDRVNSNPNYYRLRQQIIEHYFNRLSTPQFGTLKRHWHFDYLLTKGKELVMAEVYIALACYNLRRLSSIYDFEVLMNKIKANTKGLNHHFYSIYQVISRFIRLIKLLPIKSLSKYQLPHFNYIYRYK
ncbi:MAG: transposase [Flavobacteriales bacterium]|nr:transposase [Flavobacteriales bacterium]